MIQTGFESRVKIQQIISNQLPEFVLEESPKVTEFLKTTTFEYPDPTDEYWNKVSRKSKIELTCHKKHITTLPITTLLNIKSYKCKKCRGLCKHTIEEAKEIAKQRNGECLSDIYINAATKLLWKCHYNHKWSATLSSVMVNCTWCPTCNVSVGEGITRNIMSKMFEVKFNRIRPKWLNGLELDGYNKKLNIAFEYKGQQHYKVSKLYYNTEEDLQKQKERDIQLLM